MSEVFSRCTTTQHDALWPRLLPGSRTSESRGHGEGAMGDAGDGLFHTRPHRQPGLAACPPPLWVLAPRPH